MNLRTLKFLLLTFIVFIVNTAFAQNTDSTKIDQKVFELGEIKVFATKDKDVVNHQEIQKFNAPTVSTAANILPSVTICNVGARNESTLYVRGFDLRSVPVFADGIPVYVPYDGYVDLGRFTDADLAKIEISKGYASILYGANTIGGAINLISLKPTHQFELKLNSIFISGNGKNANAYIGSRTGKFYFQADFSKFERKFVPLSKDFDTSNLQNSWNLDNSYNSDEKANVKIGFQPNKTDEYSLNFIYQHGEKGNPLYLGTDPTIKVRFWQWPKWDKQSVYFISKTQVAQKTYVSTRLFLDKFINQLNAYDDATYTTQTKKYAFTSYYNDYTYGGSIEAQTDLIKNNTLKIAGIFKNDVHRENNEGEPVLHFSDNNFSFGIEDIYTAFGKLELIPGISYNIRKSLIAENYDSKHDTITPFTPNESTAMNEQIAIIYNFSNNFNLIFTTAHKTRFATMKDRYSYKLGIAIPNPYLKPEEAMNYDFSSSIELFDKISIEPSIFYSNLDNTIQSVDNVEPGISQMQNTGKAEFLGADITLNYQILSNLMFAANYSYIKRNNLSNPEILFTDVPKHKVFSYIDFQPVKAIDFIVSGEYDSQRYSTSYGNVAPEFFVFNSQISFSFAKYFQILAGINNLLDKNYCLAEGYPAEGRNFYASLIFKFNK